MLQGAMDAKGPGVGAEPLEGNAAVAPLLPGREGAKVQTHEAFIHSVRAIAADRIQVDTSRPIDGPEAVALSQEAQTYGVKNA